MEGTPVSTDAIAAARMELAEAVTDASRSLDRDRRRLERLRDALATLYRLDPGNTALDNHLSRLTVGIVEIQTLNNDVRKMNT